MWNMGFGYNSMMGGSGALGGLLWLVVLADLILVGVWLWQQITKKP